MASVREQLAEDPADSGAMAYRRPADLAAVREYVRSRAGRLGLTEERADLLTIAVSELATNTLQHTSGGGRVRVWGEADRVCVEVVDQGAAPTFGRVMPAANEARGRGLAIVERICDEVGTEAGPDGTSTRLSMFR